MRYSLIFFLLFSIGILANDSTPPSFGTLLQPVLRGEACACNIECSGPCRGVRATVEFKESDSLIVHLWTDPVSEKEMNTLYSLLKEDGIRVLYCDTSWHEWTHGIVVTPKSFKKVFKGFESSYPYIDGYEVPKRYKAYVNTIRFPDPKVYGYYYYDAESWDNVPFEFY